MYRWTLVALLAVLTGRPVVAQMHLTVEADRVRFGHGEFIPRFAAFLRNVLIVRNGQTVTLPPDSTWDAIEVQSGGTLRVSRMGNTTVRFTHLMILPGGWLDAGAEGDPVLGHIEFVVRDVPIDTAVDPFQWGNGIVNFGKQTRVGWPVVSAWTELAGDAPAGATSLMLSEVPSWRVGDELLLPDMRQVRSGALPRRSAPVHIAAINGNALTLSAPLDFARLSITDPDGGVVLRPRIANLTRNIVIKSENPSGTRGHTVNIGDDASWDIRYNQFIGLGRTTAADLDNTTVDQAGNVTRIGMNQIGKYANHDHHAGSSLAVRQNIRNSYQGTRGSKWAHAVHGTHDALIEENVCVDFQAGCFVTEDGYEVRNVFRRNVAAYSISNGRAGEANAQIDPRRGTNSPGGEGSGFWFRGLQQVIEGNESWNNVIGINLFNQSHVGAGTLVPSVKGGAPDVAHKLVDAVPLSFRGNVTLGNQATGLEYWAVARFPVEDHISAHNQHRQVFGANSQNNHIYLRNVIAVAGDGTSTCIASSSGYIPALEVEGGAIKGCSVGMSGGGAVRLVRFIDVVLQNRTNLVFAGFPHNSRFEDVMHRPLGANPKRYIEFGNGFVWDPSKPIPNQPARWLTSRETTHALVNWQGTGQNYLLFEKQQERGTLAWPARDSSTRHYAPEPITMGESWDKYGLAYHGAAVDSAQTVTLEGVTNGLAIPGLNRPLGPPRAVLTFPNMISPLVVKGASTKLYVTLTGDDRAASDFVVISVDGQPPIRRRGQGEITTKAVSMGTHEVRTWREDRAGQKIPASEMTFRYVVSE